MNVHSGGYFGYPGNGFSETPVLDVSLPLSAASGADIDDKERVVTDARKPGESERRLACATSGILHVGSLAAGPRLAQTST
jgi:hypothetical protein